MTKFLFALAPLALVLGLAPTAFAGPGDGEQRRRPDRDRPSREEVRAKMIERFDADGNGKLDEAERKAMFQAIRERRAERGAGDRGPRAGEGRPGKRRPGQAGKGAGKGRPGQAEPGRVGMGKGQPGPGQPGMGKGRQGPGGAEKARPGRGAKGEGEKKGRRAR